MHRLATSLIAVALLGATLQAHPPGAGAVSPGGRPGFSAASVPAPAPGGGPEGGTAGDKLRPAGGGWRSR